MLEGFNNINEIEEAYQREELTKEEAIQALIDEFNYSLADAQSTVDSWID